MMRKIKQKFLAVLITAALTSSLFGTTAFAVTGSQIAADGSYTATANISDVDGASEEMETYNWDDYEVTAAFNVTDGVLADLEISSTVSDSISAFYYNAAVSGVTEALTGLEASVDAVEAADIDTVSYATCTNEAIQTAVIYALEEADAAAEDTDDSDDSSDTDDSDTSGESGDITYSVPVDLSDDVNGMDFGAVLDETAIAVLHTDGTVTLTLTFDTVMVLDTYLGWVSAFYGYYDGDTLCEDFTYTTTIVTDENGEEQTALNTVTFTVSGQADSYDLSYYLSSNVMSFTREKTMTIDWDSAVEGITDLSSDTVDVSLDPGESYTVDITYDAAGYSLVTDTAGESAEAAIVVDEYRNASLLVEFYDSEELYVTGFNGLHANGSEDGDLTTDSVIYTEENEDLKTGSYIYQILIPLDGYYNSYYTSIDLYVPSLASDESTDEGYLTVDAAALTIDWSSLTDWEQEEEEDYDYANDALLGFHTVSASYAGTGTYAGMDRLLLAVSRYFGYRVGVEECEDGSFNLIVYFGGEIGYHSAIGDITVYETEDMEDDGTVITQTDAQTYIIPVSSLDEPVYCALYVGGSMDRTITYALTPDSSDYTGHSYDEGTVTTQATADTDGEITYTCTVCGHTYTETIAASGSSGQDQTDDGSGTDSDSPDSGSSDSGSGTDSGSSDSGSGTAGSGTDSGSGSTGAAGTSTGQSSQKITVKKNTLKKTYKAAKLKSKKQTFRVKASAKGKITYKKLRGSKALKISKTGKVTVKKGTAKGTYKITVRVTAAKTAGYKKATKKITVTVKVK